MSKTLLDGGSTTTSGGTSQVFGQSGETIANGVVLVDTGEADYFARHKINMVSRAPALQGDGSFSKGKFSTTYVMPLVLADGSTVFNTIRVELSAHPEATAANFAELREKGAQCIVDSEFDNFWTLGSLA